MRKGAKVLPNVLGKKLKGWISNGWQEYKENVRLKQQARVIEDEAEKTAYKEELMKQAKIRGVEKGKRRARGSSRESGIAEMLGFNDFVEGSKKEGDALGCSTFLFEGLGKKEKEKN